MSHFTVLVIGEDYEEQLAPYDEEIRVPPYRVYWDADNYATWRRILADPEKHGEGEYDEEAILHDPENASNEEIVRVYNERYRSYDDQLYVDEKGIYELSTYSQDAKWDWYEVGGRWSGYFKLKKEALAKATIGGSGVFGNAPKHDADIVRKGDVDVEGMRDYEGNRAGDDWDKVHALIDDLPAADPWEVVRERHPDNINAARAEYHAQPRVSAIAQRRDLVSWEGGVEEYQVSREVYVQQARDAALPTFAYVYRGEWFEPGKMGWWGVSTDTAESRMKFRREFNVFFDALPDDTLLTLVDCHT